MTCRKVTATLTRGYVLAPQAFCAVIGYAMTKPGEGSRSPSSRTLRYRIVAAEAHSWAALLLEDDRGQFHLHHVGTTATTAITSDTAKSLLESRTYRAWRGSQTWAVLDQLPVVSSLGGSQGTGEIPFVADIPPDEVHSG